MTHSAITDILNRLTEISTNLYAYCHHEKCDQPGECPIHHKKCRKKLGLDTAIAWQAAHQVESCISHVIAKTEYRQLPTYYRRAIAENYRVLGALLEIVRLHSKDFAKLDGLVTMAYNLVRDLYYTNLEDEEDVEMLKWKWEKIYGKVNSMNLSSAL